MTAARPGAGVEATFAVVVVGSARAPLAVAAGGRVSRIIGAGADDPDAVVGGIRDADLFDPWILVADDAEREVVAMVAERVLAGEPGVFGLAGVVLVGTTAVPTVIADLEIPTALCGRDEVEPSIQRLCAEIGERAVRVPPAWARIVASSRTDAAVRAILARRALADDPAYRPRALDHRQLALLREVAAALVPQGAGPVIDLGARVDRMVAAGESDGWRPSGMATDTEAYRTGLDALAAIWPDDAAGRDAVIRAVIDEKAPSGPPLSAGQLRVWFEDLRNDLTRVWLSHPASLARVGYSGFATGGTGPAPAGYRVLAAGQREEWEPVELGRVPDDELSTGEMAR